jgi:hypothetical protein
VSGGKAWVLANSPAGALAHINGVPNRFQGAGISEVGTRTLTFSEPSP